MFKYSEVNGKLTNKQLNKLKKAVKPNERSNIKIRF